MLLVLAAVKMKDSETDRHKRAFWDLLQLQEAASPSKFATWQWWSACLIRWCVSPQVCTPRRTRKHNWECVQRLECCLTTSLVCLCLCVLRLLSSLSCLFHPLPRLLSVCLSWRESWGNRWKSIRREQTSYIPSVMFRKQFNVLGWRYALLLRDNGESVNNSPCRHEVNRSLVPGCTVFLPVAHSKWSSHSCDAAPASTAYIALLQASYCHITCDGANLSAHNYWLHARQFTCQPHTSKPLLDAAAIVCYAFKPE